MPLTYIYVNTTGVKINTMKVWISLQCPDLKHSKRKKFVATNTVQM
jgi:hypothetical protein